MMKRIFAASTLLLFFAGMFFLADYLFPEIRLQIKNIVLREEKQKVLQWPLGEVEVLDYRRMGFTSALLRFSPDSRLLAVGSELGEVMVFEVNGRKLWQSNVGGAKITALEFSSDGRKLYIGEASPQGLLRATDSQTGETLWQRESVKELGAELAKKSHPAIIHINCDSTGRVYAIGQRYQRKADGSNQYLGRVYRFLADGKEDALFPVDHNLDTWVGCIATDYSGEKSAIATAGYDSAQRHLYNEQLYLLDSQLHGIERSVKIDAISPYNNVTLRKSPEMSADGRFIASIATDGRAFLHDSEGKELWRRQLSAPKEVAGVYVNATGLYLKLTTDRVAFTTGNTYNRANWQLPTPVEHPSGNSFFLFDLSGNFLARQHAGGMIEQLNGNKETAALAVGRNIWTKDPLVHGLLLLNMKDGSEVRRFATNGPCVASAISFDGAYCAAVEAPLKLDNGEIIGDYRLHVWRVKEERMR